MSAEALGKNPVNYDVSQTPGAGEMGKVERFLFRVLVEAPVLGQAWLVDLGKSEERPINADVPHEFPAQPTVDK